MKLIITIDEPLFTQAQHTIRVEVQRAVQNALLDHHGVKAPAFRIVEEK